jgi:Domain of unknown function (DUF389)
VLWQLRDLRVGQRGSVAIESTDVRCRHGLIVRGPATEVLAALAGVVGVVSLTEARSSTLMGVFIAVTTIPAASDIGVSLAFGSGRGAWGSTLQLLLNVTVLAAGAIAGLPARQAIWRRVARRATAAPPG